MSAKVYIINDCTAIDFIKDNDTDGFGNYLAEGEYLMFGYPVVFETKHEALTFCCGLGHSKMDGTSVEQFPLRSFEVYDQPFIEVIENYCHIM